MKTSTTFKPRPRSRALYTLLLGAMALWAMPATALAQIFVTNYNNGTIGEYTTTGATVNAALITGLNQPYGIAVSGGNLFVVNNASGTIGEYTTTGETVNAALITGLHSPAGIAVSGGNLFVVNHVVNSGTIGEYTASGATVNASLITGLINPLSIAVSGENLFVTNFLNANAGTIGEYTSTGATVNAALITGLNGPGGIAVSGGNLFVGVSIDGTISEYTTSGATVNASLITGLNNPQGIAASGGNLFVKDGNAIGEYNAASGATVNAALITGFFNVLGIYVSSVTVTSSWSGTNSTNWADSANWSDAAPGATTGTANTDTALFNQSAPNSPLTIDAGRNVQNITLDTANVNSLTIGTVGGQALLLTAGGSIQSSPTVSTAQMVNAPLVLEGPTTLNSNATSSSATLSFGGGITPGATSGVTTLTLNGANIGANTISGVLADNGAGQLAVTMNGTGVWILSGANTYSGGTTINSGTLKTTTSGALGSGSLTINGSGSILDLGNTNQNVGAVNIAAGTIQNGTLTATSFTVNNSAALTFPSTLILAGAGGLTKTSTGTLTLSDLNTFSGGTTINSGALTTTASGALGSGPLTINGSGVTSALTLGASQTVSSLTSDESGTGSVTVNVATVATLNSTGALTTTGTLNLLGNGTTEIDGAPTLNNNSMLELSRGTLRFKAASGSATIGTGVTATVAVRGTLELAGSVSALSSGANRVNIINTSIAAAGLLVSGTHQQVGNIDGSGITQVNGGSDLTANHIVQSALVVGGTAGNPGLVTIDASDASGNPLGQSSGLALAGSLASNDPFADGIGSASLIDGAASGDSNSVETAFSQATPNAGIGPATVPEPSTILLSAVGLLGLLINGIRRRRMNG
ncbi:MAG TPA: autotransporter-associated beta strand repeat-containing protein [Pirellulales bacterium]|nr:autotransporter-associated beta strand repeat-containing protein [Pirellulales bacterium]